MEKTSVEINGVFVRLTEVPDALVRFCRPPAFYNQGSEYQLTLAGTCFLVRYLQKFVLVTTRHQLGRGEGVREPNEACLILEKEGRRVAFTCSQYTRPTFPADDEHRVAEDILFLQFDAQAYSGDLRSRFLETTRMRSMDEVSDINVTLYFTIGYPTEFTELVINLGDPEEVSVEGSISRFSKIYLETERKQSMPAHIEFRVHRDHPITLDNFDGLSGSPVFFLYQDDVQQSHLGFAEMIRLVPITSSMFTKGVTSSLC